jgi:hypothetical protein
MQYKAQAHQFLPPKLQTDAEYLTAIERQSRMFEEKNDSSRRDHDSPSYSRTFLLQCKIKCKSVIPLPPPPSLIPAASAPPRGKSGTPFQVSRRAPWWLRRRLQMGNRAHIKKSADRSKTLSDTPRAIFRRSVRLWKRHVRAQTDQLGPGQKYNYTRLLHFPLKASSIKKLLSPPPPPPSAPAPLSLAIPLPHTSLATPP